jgi:hypothetical protein
VIWITLGKSRGKSLGFDVKAGGRFDEATRAMILRRQAARVT